MQQSTLTGETVDLTQKMTEKLGNRYSGTLREFQRSCPGRTYSAHWACLRAFAKYHGVYPVDFLPRVYTFLEVKPDWTITHLFAGTVKPIYPNETRVDLNPRVGPDLLEDATHTSIASNSQQLVLTDPPYDRENAAVYGYPFPGMKKVAVEAARITMPGGFFGILAWYPIPRAWTGLRFRTAVITISEGSLMRYRGLSLFQKPAR